jgi:hypothetical protein
MKQRKQTRLDYLNTAKLSKQSYINMVDMNQRRIEIEQKVNEQVDAGKRAHSMLQPPTDLKKTTHDYVRGSYNRNPAHASPT